MSLRWPAYAGVQAYCRGGGRCWSTEPGSTGDLRIFRQLIGEMACKYRRHKLFAEQDL